MSTLSPPSINDFRKNAERQRREQRSTATLVSTASYFFLGGLVLIAVLAGFGGYVLWKQIKNQSVTVAQLDTKYAEKVDTLEQNDAQTKKALVEQIALNQQQQEKITKIVVLIEKASTALREEKDARIREIGKIVQRIQRLESRKQQERSEAKPVVDR